MNIALRSPILSAWCAAAVILLGGCAGSSATRTEDVKKEVVMMSEKATGPFEVKLEPVGTPEKGPGSTLGRMTIDKQFHGDLEAASKGEMLSAMTDTKGSAGYVAIERVTGSLNGKHGTFVLQHNATMDRGTPSLNIIVVPDSATDELVGLTGTMKINIEGGKHSYEFDYMLPQP